MAYITENINNKGISFDIEGAHNKWHSVIESQINELELSEQDIEYYYELEICCDMRYISSIDVETKIILPKQITMGTFWMNLWHKNLFTRMFTEHNKLTESDTDALSYNSCFEGISSICSQEITSYTKYSCSPLLYPLILSDKNLEVLIISLTELSFLRTLST